ncbi:MAG: hypothetical protein L3J18_06960 [Candidatus Brocadia sp.]|jgi:hypothetical protein|uniref:Uncharacterized protein n=1 Tax=Candidatus Brocadia fulgida TaxID=380242 RepID=A0A0M2URB2_9BACT|nr:MAG: hypothetical protein BROFUL_02918 [Candidatus Brocadia fulgida]MBV6518312.1 hypothetical protein [Candidatus Brocadia fulgida]UJS22043.1 MAG: hypothetical protein L3J18_06960 [Candidatus Brocadia sp.]
MQDHLWKVFIGGIVVLTVGYLVYFLKIVVEYMKEATLGLTIFYPL